MGGGGGQLYGTKSRRLIYFLVMSGGADESKLGVSGDSAGGRLAAVVCHEAHQIIDFAVCNRTILVVYTFT